VNVFSWLLMRSSYAIARLLTGIIGAQKSATIFER